MTGLFLWGYVVVSVLTVFARHASTPAALLLLAVTVPAWPLMWLFVLGIDWGMGCDLVAEAGGRVGPASAREVESARQPSELAKCPSPPEPASASSRSSLRAAMPEARAR